jgi:5S rRNA maturation endonuclease (ribonuclease M5)
LAQFQKRLAAIGVPRSEFDRRFRWQHSKGSQYLVEACDPEYFSQLLSLYTPEGVPDRVQAAQLGNSHRAPVSGSFLLVRRLEQPHPQVVLFDSRGSHTPFQQGRDSLLIENLENFLRFTEVIHYLKAIPLFANEPQAFANVDVIYGQGAAITNQLHTDMIKRYRTVWCLFDLDLGGVRMFASLYNALRASAVDCHFLVPDDALQRLTHSNRMLTAEDRTALARYRGLTHELDQAINLMRETSRTLEQEVYLLRRTD